jgi:hypothetical protein
LAQGGRLSLLELLPAEFLQHSHDQVALNACVSCRRHVIVRPANGPSSLNTNTTCALHWDLHHTLLRLLVQTLMHTASNSVCCQSIVRSVRAGVAPHHDTRRVLQGAARLKSIPVLLHTQHANAST